MRVTGERNPSLYQGKININTFLMRVTGERNPFYTRERLI